MIAAGTTELLIETGNVEVRILRVDVVVNGAAVTVGIEDRGFTVVLVHLTIHGVVRVEAVVLDGVSLVVDLDVLVTVVDGSSQGDTLRAVRVHGNLSSVAENNSTLFLLPVFDVFTVELFVGVAPVLDGVLAGRVFDGDSVLVDGHTVAPGGGVRDWLALLLLIQLAHSATLSRTAAAWGTAAVKVLLTVLRLVISTELRTAEVVSVAGRVGSAAVMLRVMMASAACTVVVGHIVSDEGTDARSG